MSRTAARYGRGFAEERRETFAAIFTGQGWPPSADAEPPRDLPAFGLTTAARRTWLASSAAERDGATWYLADLEIGGLQATGWNVDVERSAGEASSATWRHTLVLVDEPRAAWPAFQAVPDVRAVLSSLVETRLEAVQGKHAGLARRFGRWFARAGDRLEAAKERGSTIELPGRLGLAGSYRVAGDDPAAVRALIDERMAAQLAARPGTIVAAEGAWLLLSRNVAPAFRAQDAAELPYGLLTEGEAAAQVAAARDLVDLLAPAP